MHRNIRGLAHSTVPSLVSGKNLRGHEAPGRRLAAVRRARGP
ncbi:hypothetical protein J2X38_004105 [Sphingopyxis sp. BE235]|nr:hypothetical protein [Sphingopyxis sp. BE235]MDR7182478.1 hypothetical protein [Sphingopyxis sp. BE249]